MDDAPRLEIDFEWRCARNVKNCGMYRILEDPTFKILVFHVHYEGREFTSYSMEPADLPAWFFDALEDDDVEIHAHNAAVERLVIQRHAATRFGWPKVPTWRFHCSASRAARLSLPRALDRAAKALKLPVQKDDAGRRVMLRLSKPIRPRKKQKVSGYLFDTDPAKMQRLGQYCATDVATERCLIERTFPLSRKEQHYYLMTERINDRGVKIDKALVTRLLWRAGECLDELNAEMDHITGGAVTKLSQVARLKEWIEAETGVSLSTMRKEDMEGLLGKEDDDGNLLEPGSFDFPKHVVRAIRIRQEGAKASVAKLMAMLNRVTQDGRIHGAFIHFGASTGRYTSQGVQLQNLIRATHKDFNEALARLDSFSLVDISMTIRGCFVPDDGHVFIDVDYNAIEARGVAWLAGAKKLLKVYQTGGDPYCDMGTVIYGFQVTKANENERFVGKQTILGCGYGMGAAKFLAQCIKFGQPVTERIAKKAVDAYRSEYPEIPALWRDMEKAAIAAVRNKGRECEAANGKIVFKYVNGFLQMRLPSGGRLFYKDPRITRVEKFGRDTWELSYMAEHPITKQWVRESTWGGKITENAVQALCRDLLFDAMDELEYDFDIPVVLSVHDQLVCEVPRAEAQNALKTVERCMVNLPKWARGFPVNAEPKIMERFGK